MPITLNGSGTITGVSSLATALVNPVVTTTMGVGNATPAASGAGITFPAALSASSDANTLDDYEEGTFTPTDGSGASLSFTSNSGSYTRIGNMVFVRLIVIYPTTSNLSQAGIILPFTSSSTAGNGGAFVSFTTTTVNPLWAYIPTSSNTVFLTTAAGAAVNNSQMSAKRIDLVAVYAAV
jgi:hypothetical protein